MKKSIILILFLSVEFFILLTIFVFLLLGVLGTFLPVIPGLIFIGLGAGLYYFLLNSRFGILSNKLNPHLIQYRNKITNSLIIIKFMGLIKKIKEKREEKVRTEIIKHGMILLAFNLLLILSFIFAFISSTLLAGLFLLPVELLSLVPLFVIFVFAGLSSIVWYRFGLILSDKFKEKKVINATLTVLVSLLPLLLIFMIYSTILDMTGGFSQELMVMAFLSLLLMSIFAAAFELLVVTLGVITKNK